VALEADFTGHEIIIVAAPRSSMREPTAELMAKYLDRRIPVKPGLTGNWSGVDSSKANAMLGFEAQHLWENYLQP
jgi:hypothetical protein